MKHQLGNLATRLDGRLSDLSLSTNLVDHFALDSRDVKPGSLFVAIKGERVDGHSFVGQALDCGAVACLVEHQIEGPSVLVPNVVDALAKMGHSFRIETNAQVIGVTGSAGKTATKALIASALKPLGSVLQTEGNRNTEYTVPLIWLEVDSNTCALVIEMSMRGLNQIDHLCSICDPEIGVITNIGNSHVDQLGSIDNIAKAKFELFNNLPSNGLAIFPRNDKYYERASQEANCELLTFGDDARADCYLSNYRAHTLDHCEFLITYRGESAQCRLGRVGKGLAQMACAAILVAGSLGISLSDAVKGLDAAELPLNRMEVEIRNGVTIIKDYYNASLASMIQAIEAVDEIDVLGRRKAIIGGMRELGEFEEGEHERLGAILSESKFEEIILFGEPTQFAREELSRNKIKKVRYAIEISELKCFLNDSGPGDVVLIKGSRYYELERVLE